MALALFLVAGVALVGESREAAAALEELAQDQGAQAAAAAQVVEAELHRRAPLPERADAGLRGVLRGMERPGYQHLFLQAPESSAFVGQDGRTVTCPPLAAALTQGQRWLRLDRTEAPQLGLPPRMAVVGLAWAEDSAGRRWPVVAAATALRERDRAFRARVRTLASLVVMGAVVLAFGGLALRMQREELQLTRALAQNEVQRQKDAQLNQASRAATMLTFAAGMAHEISTPLGIIAGRAQQLVERFAGDEKGARAARSVVDEAEGIGRMVRRFLDLARGGSPALEVAAPLDLVRSAQAMVEHRFLEAGVSLDVHVPEGLPTLRGDTRLLVQVLVNLLLNACDVARRVTLEVGLDSGSLAFVVADDGAGMAPEVAARVLEPFFSTKPQERGSGLGLAIAHEIVKMHRGSLQIQSQPQRGTRVTVLLPV
ncbi:MAG TPA: HAMP domain-containing sensor histidine kinase [Holophagaceae bacterium]|nr:HAMP domain-containing sensor histidine kinase [Holophagaceae bacterium]